MIQPGQTYEVGQTRIRVLRVTPGPLGNEIAFSAGGSHHVRSEATFRKWLAGEPLKGKQRMPKPQKRDESKLVKAAIDYLNLMGCFVWRNQTGVSRPMRSDGGTGYVPFGKVGSGDILGMTPTGRFISVECKVKGRKPTEHQEAFAAAVRKHGGIAMVIYDLDELEEQYKRQA